MHIYYPRLILALILIGYLITATLFAIMTPPWQMPDEPAHYNYIAHIARERTLPVLAMGDFDMDYIGQIVSERFPPELSVEPLRYEFYQPPLYYLTAVPIYLLAGGADDILEPSNYGHALIAIRLYGVLLGLLSLCLLYGCLSIVSPNQPAVRLCAVAFAATLPMHVAMTAAVNNDSLAILLLLASSLVLLRWMKAMLLSSELPQTAPISPSTTPPESMAAPYTALQDKSLLLVLGLLLGFGLMTKIYAYIYLPVCIIMIGLVSLRRGSFRLALVNSGWVLLPALLLGVSLWIRNISLYGMLDPLGLTWHDAVVIGQATTQEWITQNGWAAYWERATTFTFRSFWGVFGWLGLFWDERLYTAVHILTIAVTTGLIGFSGLSVVHGINFSNETNTKEQQQAFQLWVALLFIITVVAVFTGYILYNLKFVQHQGRYFFWGMLPISTFFALGWRQLMRPRAALCTALLLGALALYSLVMGDRNPWTLLAYVIIIALLVLQALLSVTAFVGNNGKENMDATEDALLWWLNRMPQTIIKQLNQPIFGKASAILLPILWAVPFLFLFSLCIHTIFGYVIPELGR